MKRLPKTIGDRAMRAVTATRRDELLGDTRKVPADDRKQQAEAQALPFDA